MNTDINKDQKRQTDLSLLTFVAAIYNFQKYKLYTKETLIRLNLYLFITFVGVILIVTSFPNLNFSTDLFAIYFVAVIFPQMLKWNKLKHMRRP
ncbi:hypothetical protein ACFFHM_09955 [Halalkalibacter kiskunsagensis]|uniref:Uncharacterized protein n=1 Tax=Halalkalibacter kiskunsagensis TaxID=1548599 RepID=A0ABV6KCX2_9BACI